MKEVLKERRFIQKEMIKLLERKIQEKVYID